MYSAKTRSEKYEDKLIDELESTTKKLRKHQKSEEKRMRTHRRKR